jgi:DmsE family decaheme c-type cytochrome
VTYLIVFFSKKAYNGGMNSRGGKIMKPIKALKAVLICGWLIGGLLWAASSTLSKPTGPDDTKPAAVANKPEDYVGSETCKTCHDGQFNSFFKTAHSKTLDYASVEKQGCEACHGPGKAHVEAGGDKTLIRTFESESAKKVSETCLQCHAGKEEHNNYRRGEHWRNDIGCIDCHAPHSTDASPLKMLAKVEQKLCLQCHNEMRGQFAKPFHHRVLEGAMKCSDCHNPHGGFEQKQVRAATGNAAACVKCHTDKQGPFVFEHAPLQVEGCTICHTPHGSTNAKLLKRNNIPQLCIECHSDIGGIGAPNTPSFHNLATARFQNCTTCHAKIHGSNTDHLYFR